MLVVPLPERLILLVAGRVKCYAKVAVLAFFLKKLFPLSLFFLFPIHHVLMASVGRVDHLVRQRWTRAECWTGILEGLSGNSHDKRLLH